MRFMLLILALVLPACGLLKPKPKAKPKTVEKPTTLVVGTVEMVNPEQHYVLIRSDRGRDLPAGTELVVMAADGTRSTVVLTPERKGTFLTADIKDGQPATMGLVYKENHLPTPPVPAPTPSTPATPPPVPSAPLPNFTLPTPQIPLEPSPAAPTALDPGSLPPDLEPPVN